MLLAVSFLAFPLNNQFRNLIVNNQSCQKEMNTHSEHVPEHFMCGICSHLVNDPVEHIDCHKLFCRSCLNDLPHPVCPNCRNRLQNKLQDPPLFYEDDDEMFERYQQLVYDQNKELKCELQKTFSTKSTVTTISTSALPVQCVITAKNPLSDGSPTVSFAATPTIMEVAEEKVSVSPEDDPFINDALQQLQSLPNQRPTILIGHTNSVTVMGYSSSQQLLFTGSDDHEVRVWDTKTNICTHTLKGHTETIACMTLRECPISDGSLLYTGSADGTIRLWNTTDLSNHMDDGVISTPATISAIHTCNDHFDTVSCLLFDRSLPTTTTITATTPYPKGISGDVVMMKEMKDRWYSASHDKTVIIWETTTTFTSSSYKPNSLLLVSTSTIPVATLKGHFSWIISLALSSNSDPSAKRFLFSASDDGVTRMWDLSTNTCPFVLSYDGCVSSILSSPYFDNRLYTAGGSCSKEIKVWNISQLISSPNTVPCFHTQGTINFTNHCHGTLKGHTCSIECIVLGPSGSRLYTSSRDGTVKVWDTSTYMCVATLDNGEISPPKQKKFPYHILYRRVLCMYIDVNSGRLIGGYNDGTLRIWDIYSHVCIATIEKAHCGDIFALLFVTKNRLYTSSSDGTVKEWDVDELTVPYYKAQGQMEQKAQESNWKQVAMKYTSGCVLC